MKGYFRSNSVKSSLLSPFFAFFLAGVLALGLLPPSHSLARPMPNEGQPADKLSPPLRQALATSDTLVWSDPSRQTVRALVQSVGPVSSGLLSAIRANGGTVLRQFSSIKGFLAELPKNRILTIAARPDVERMSADHLAQKNASHLEATTGTDQLRSYSSLLNTYSGLDGGGIGIAILDSGIMAGHN